MSTDGSKSSSLHAKLDKVSGGRVCITDDVEAGGVLKKVELPFVVGVLADLSGQPKEALKPLKERNATFIDRDNFNDVMAKTAPRLEMRVANKLTEPDSKLAVELNFTQLDDFGPAQVVRQIRPLKHLLEVRRRLAESLSSLEGNDRLEQMLSELVSDPRRCLALIQQLDREVALSETKGQTSPAVPPESRDSRPLPDLLVELLQPGQGISSDAEMTFKRWIARIDQLLSAQLREIMHHPDFQRLESTWRGLHYLVHQSETGEVLKIRVLNVSKRELFRDSEMAVDFDYSALFKKVYEDEYRVLGGKPYGLLVGDYAFSRSPEDISLLTMISQVAATAHAPFVAAASPKLFGMDRFDELSRPRDLAMTFDGIEYAAWKSFRESEDSAYVALTLPRVLARLPYGANFKRVSEFDFEELADGKDHDKHVWMSAAWAYAACVTTAFAKHGWFIRTRGVEGGGKVEGLPLLSFPTDDGDVAMNCPTEVAINDRREFELSNLGFLPLLHSRYTGAAVFMGAQSCQKPQRYSNPAADAKAELSAKLNLRICACRFVPCLKLMTRHKIASFMDTMQLEAWLSDWLKNYVADPRTATEATQCQRPLSAGRVEARPVQGKPGWYELVIYLRPCYQCEELTSELRLVAEVPKLR